MGERLPAGTSLIFFQLTGIQTRMYTYIHTCQKKLPKTAIFGNKRPAGREGGGGRERDTTEQNNLALRYGV